MNTSAIPQLSTAVTAQNQGYNVPGGENSLKGQQKHKSSLQEDKYNIANSSDELLKSIANYEAYQQYKDDPTRDVTKAAFPTFLVADSFTQGVMKQGSGSAKLAKTTSTASDWGIFTGAVWLYNKGLEKMYDILPGAKKLREEHPGVAYAGEVVSGTALGWGAVSAYNRMGGNKLVENSAKKMFDKMPGLSQKAGDFVQPLSNFAQKNPKVMALGYLGAGVTALGLIAKNIYDVFHTKQTADNRFEELKGLKKQANSEIS